MTDDRDSNRIPAFDPFLTDTGASVVPPDLATASIPSKYEEQTAMLSAPERPAARPMGGDRRSELLEQSG